MPAADDIRGAVAAVITGLDLSPTPAVKVRKRLAVAAEDGDNVIVVAMPGGEQSEAYANRRKLVTYAVAVAYAARRGNVLGAAGADVTAWKDAAEAALFRAGLTGVPSVSSVVPEAGASWLVAGLDDNWDFVTSALTVESIEPRN